MLTAKTRTRSTSHHGWLLLTTGLIAAGLVATLRWLLAFAAGGQAPPDAAPALPPGEVLMAAAGAAAGGVQRDDGAPDPAVAAEALPFERQIDLLAGLQQETTAAVQDDEIERAKAADEQARQGFTALLQQFPDAGERGLAMLTDLPADAATSLDHGRHVVLQFVITAECARRHEEAEVTRDRSRLDTFVGLLLAAMGHGEKLAALGEAVLEGQPYLRLVHEPAVLDLARLAGAGRVPRPTATRLLLTLWDNLRRTGERTAGELASLAMLLLTDPDPSKRTAACRHLLADPGYRHVVLAWLREQQDAAVSTEVAALAAQHLPPMDALAVLRELAPALPSMPGAYLALAHRAPEILIDAYHELLAADTHAAVRADLIAGLAMTGTPAAAAAVELALQSDPSPEVRVQAMLSATATAATTHGEAACHRILDDPGLASDPARLAVVVFALQNLEAAGLTNAVDRLGQRLRHTPLREDSRQALEVLLARALPNGRTSNGRTSR